MKSPIQFAIVCLACFMAVHYSLWWLLLIVLAL